MKLAAISYEAGGGAAVDAILRDIANELRANGIKVAGAVQYNEPDAVQSRCDMVLEDLATGQRFNVSAEQSKDPHACRLNAYALENVAGLVASSIGPGIDLVILNRFGKQEAARAGFRAIIEAAVANDLPVLTGLNSAHRALWKDFTGEAAADVALNKEAVQKWCADVLAGQRETAV
jgi:nucleoside-triphosphatase THEP1